MNEIWKEIKGFEGLYEISNFGRVRNFKTKKLMKDTLKKSGYHEIRLSKNKKRYNCSIHRLVAENFIPNINNLRDVNHKDGNKSNNHVSNLEWLSHKDNIRHGFNNNLYNIEKHTKRCIENNKKYENGIVLLNPNNKEIVFTGTVIECAKFVGLKTRSSYISNAIKEEKEYKGYIWKKVKNN